MTGRSLQPDRDRAATDTDVLLDPRQGDIEDDASSPKQRSLLAIAGSLLAEISLPKLLFAWTVSILLPAVLLGLAPLIATAWFAKVSRVVAELTGFGAALLLLAIIGLGWFGWRPLLQTAEVNFWSLNALAVQPGYAFCREAFRYLTEHTLGKGSGVHPAGASACDQLRRGRHHALRFRRADRSACLAGLAVGGNGRGSA